MSITIVMSYVNPLGRLAAANLVQVTSPTLGPLAWGWFRPGSSIRQDEPFQQFADGEASLGRMPHGKFRMDLVTILPPIAEAANIAGFFQVVEDALHGPLGNADDSRDLPRRHAPAVLGQTEEDLGVIGQKRPASHG